MERSEATGKPESPQPGRSVAKEPELLSRSYRNRVRKLSPGNQNQGVKHLPGSHTRLYGLMWLEPGPRNDPHGPFEVFELFL